MEGNNSRIKSLVKSVISIAPTKISILRAGERKEFFLSSRVIWDNKGAALLQNHVEETQKQTFDISRWN